MNRLTLSGLVVGAALTGSGCVSYQQHQDEMAQLRAELSALKTEVETLKGGPEQTADAPSVSETADAADESHAKDDDDVSPPSETQVSLATWEDALEKHNDEPRDLAWSRAREPELVALAKAHIKSSGASLNGVRCKTTSCLITVNVPKDPKVTYDPLDNPWAQTQMLSHHKPIYSGRTLWSYLLDRHDKDTKEAGAERVNPLELAQKSPELVRPSVVVAVASPTTEASPNSPTAKSTPAASPSNTAAQTASSTPAGQASAKTAAQTASSKPAATSPSKAPAAGASTKTSSPSSDTSSKASSTASSAAAKTTTPQKPASSSAAQATQKQAAASSSATKAPASR